jgi:hypothetical protein
MSDIFNIKRFGLLFREQTSKNLKLFLMGAVLVFAVLMILDIIFIIAAGHYNVKFDIRLGFYSIFIFPAACLLSSSWFSYLSRRAPETGNLLLPVSAFERILTAFIINVIIFSIVYFLIVLSVEIILFQDFQILHYVTHFLEYYTFYSILFLFQSFFLIGSLIFKKAAIIKTGFSIFVMFIILQLINNLVISIVFRNIPNLNFGDVFFVHGNNIIAPPFFETISKWLIYLGLPLVWVASYFKLKEKQV